MEEIEEAGETARELLEEHVAEEAAEIEERLPWIRAVGISTMVMALFSAIGALYAGITANEALLERTAEIMDVVDRDRDLLQVDVLTTKQEVLAALGQPIDDGGRLAALRREVETLHERADEGERAVRHTLHHHEVFAIGVTILSIAITLSGMAVVARRKQLWFAGLGLGAIGVGTVTVTLVHVLTS